MRLPAMLVRCAPIRGVVVAACLAAAPAAGAAGPPLSWSDLLERPRPKPDAVLSYAPGPSHTVDLWRPVGAGPFAVAVLIHGGCWTKSVADHGYFNYAAADLRARGLAVWNVEYRGVDEPGGGYPGTYQDVGAALDLLTREATRLHLRLDRVVVAGHSAGGQLALWAAARAKLPVSSPLHADHPLRVDTVVDLAGLADLEHDLHTACGAEPVRAMAGPERPGGRYADTSPAALAPLGVPTVVLHGRQDHTVPPAVGEAYAARARAAGDPVELLEPPGAHVEEVAPGSVAWALAADRITAVSEGAR